MITIISKEIYGKTMQSALFRLSKNDFLKGLVVSVLAAILSFIATSLQANGFVLDINEMIRIGFLAGLSYLSKNYLSDEGGRVLGKIG